MQNARKMVDLLIEPFGAHGGRFAKRSYCWPKISKHYKRNCAAGTIPCGAVAFVLSELSRRSVSLSRANRAIWYEPFFTVGKIFFPSSLIFFPILKKVFVTNFVTCITNFVICVSKFVTSVTKFVIKIVCADNEKLQGERKNFQGERKKLLGATKTHKADNLHGNSGAYFHTYEKT